MKEKLVVIVGPTAVGKTKTSIELAKALHGEVISGDSMQVYRGMDIGTAKIKREEMEGVPHHLIDICDPIESFSVASFQSRVKPLITSINERGHIPFIVGGTGLYIKAVTHDYQFAKAPSDPRYREELEAFVEVHGVEELHKQLKEVDPLSYETIHPNNYRRVIRALEVYHLTKRTIGDFQEKQPDESPYDLVMIGLTMDRKVLYERINLRVDLMIKQGLIEEAERLYAQGVRDCQSVQAIGYKEIYEYIEGKVSKQEAIELLKRNSRRYAKRQLTWFRNKADVTWFDLTDGDTYEKIAEIKNFVEGKLF
ncbi:tRNA (adenosine(37)-N6)-dimethylallyltransferase MiaA [Desertibacillus haloalkaliphilus]|uniref:tRNA (adenosine(37)-N6)-dimethylallyltransferase MiaA n=1 Tax=Desertibacillus haloalkaliphilus TaxID=1328930 RepID=UPI001C2756B5|nr:tRNA (adenosine(37)-N6)-dimethylallyltransferase MiaA [Desertibacillus haloalkaliphilus]MBU8907380.1 tRNA (adenosine(37)-N6)-dimethylallyltransferase MiaA [Desertibacillus haloalkaliphilus]